MFFFNDTATTEIYTLSLHDALPISTSKIREEGKPAIVPSNWNGRGGFGQKEDDTILSYKDAETNRSEEHTSELQSRQYLVCRLLLEKKKTYSSYPFILTLLCLSLSR